MICELVGEPPARFIATRTGHAMAAWEGSRSGLRITVWSHDLVCRCDPLPTVGLHACGAGSNAGQPEQRYATRVGAPVCGPCVGTPVPGWGSTPDYHSLHRRSCVPPCKGGCICRWLLLARLPRA